VSEQKIGIFFSFLIFLLISLVQISPSSHAQASLTPFKASPDQVLVLYNADWQKDVDGSEPGQDSKEVAEYYVEMHTDSITGKKPYLLGLRCMHREKHLNQWVIREKSQDNKDGIVFVGKGRGPKTGEWARDSRQVEIVIDPGKLLIGWDSVEIWCRSDQNVEKKLVSPIISGIPRKKGRKFVYPDIEEDKSRCYRFDAHELFKGTVWVIFKAKNRSGKLVRNLKLKYYDRDDFRFSLRGKDGIVDEKHFQEDVAIPVKRFLEDRANALPDGTLLKDHILYIVVCHGLPFSCEGVLGIERGVNARPGDHGDLGSLEQRLQTLYYDWGRKIVPPVISMYMSGGPDSNKGVRNYRITNAMRYCQVGRRWNPYMHPDAYSFLAGKKEPQFINIPPFPEVRKKISPYLFAYAVSRIDGQGPREAKRLIDYSLYASKFLRPEMDRSVREHLKKETHMSHSDIKDNENNPPSPPFTKGGKTLSPPLKKGDTGGFSVENTGKLENLSDRLNKAEQKNRWGSEEEEYLGFRVLSRYGGQGIPFGGRPLEDVNGSTSNSENNSPKYLGYYPGGMDRTVSSSNGWNMSRSAPIWRQVDQGVTISACGQVDQGVTISACGGPAYGGGPHITNATFWDNRILLRYLFRGRDLGECFLLSTYYVNWSTSLLGDPLLHPDLSKTVLDVTPPRVATKESIRIALEPAMGKYTGTMTIPVISTKLDPEVARLTVFYSKEGENTEQVTRWPIYSTQPYVMLRNLEPETIYIYRPVLTDPYGNSTDLTTIFGRLSFRTGSINDEKTSPPRAPRAPRVAKKRSKSWEIDLLRLTKLSEHGTIEVEFSAGEDGLMPSIISENLNLKISKGYKGQIWVSMQIGGPPQKWHLKSPLQEGKKATLILRWRRFPLTREVLLQAKDGTEFTLAADIRTPWEKKKLRVSIIIKERNQVKIISAKIRDDALPASSEACRITVPPVDEVAWRNANE
jgi:hypothetical protein